ncbi:TOBE domain-containing protein [Halobaculum gomorrense]|uniref:Molybdate transport system regulatory protein n=1 Tax=Halobaculum gomorrense TaxID=43928 RepID=A0A1M5LVY6_9EURY|nr:TOBE domain-containing protein [Halobaculum gomorrense]SHG69264.1 molybdate transport system regulatory protein [Halobaculum gomorrense]
MGSHGNAGSGDGEGTAGFEASLTAGEATFDGRDAALLRAIAAAGSVSGAASDLGRSRARALSRLEALEAAFGDLVERRRGGADGGGSRLTGNAEALLARFARLTAALAGTAGAAESVFDGTVTGREGELAVVDTGAGTLRALAVGDSEPGSGDAVQVSVRADAVTLHDPSETPSPDATSARNRFSGVASAVDRGDAVVDVRVDVGAGDPLAALVTVDSADRLGLREGSEVVASFKATATRATRTGAGDGAAARER